MVVLHIAKCMKVYNKIQMYLSYLYFLNIGPLGLIWCFALGRYDPAFCRIIRGCCRVMVIMVLAGAWERRIRWVVPVLNFPPGAPENCFLNQGCFNLHDCLGARRLSPSWPARRPRQLARWLVGRRDYSAVGTIMLGIYGMRDKEMGKWRRVESTTLRLTPASGTLLTEDTVAPHRSIGVL
jgi:hypothetical protein